MSVHVTGAHSDRPWRRKLIRTAFQFFSPGRSHWQDTWPGLKIDESAGAILWKGKTLAPLCAPQQIIPENAELLTIVGSGPSLRDQDITAIPEGSAILCNGAASLIDRLTPLALAVEDERFIFRHIAMLQKVPREIPAFLSPSAIRAWAEYDAPSLHGRRVVPIYNLRRPVFAKKRELSDPDLGDILVQEGNAALSRRPEVGVVITGTIAYSALQFALDRDPDAILLAGIDLNNDHKPRFYEGSDCAKSGLSKGRDRILSGFALAQRYARDKGIELRCASGVSELLELGYTRDTILETHP